MGRYRWVVLGAGVTAQAAYSALGTGVAVLVPDLRQEYGLSLGQIGLLLAAASGGMVLTLIAWGLLTDRVGERVVVALGLSVSGWPSSRPRRCRRTRSSSRCSRSRAWRAPR